jgi:hypothetical protein
MEDVAHMEDMKNAYKILISHLKGRDHLEVLGVTESVTLKCVENKQGGRVCTELIWFRTRTSGGSLGHGNETSGSKTGRKLLQYMVVE